MLDVGWQELLVIGALALIVVGPKDLPGLLRSVGQWVGKVRGMARDFQRAMNDAARETEKTAFKDLSDLKKINPLEDFKKQAQNAQSFLNGTGDKSVVELEKKPAEKAEPAARVEAAAPAAGETPAPGPADTIPAAAAEAAPAPASDDSKAGPKAATT